MNEAAKIDRQRPMRISGSVIRNLANMPHDPLHEIAMDLAQERIDPAFLRLSDTMEEACFEFSCSEFLSWIDTHPKWAEAFYSNLQSLAETAAGEPLLTTWLSVEKFWAMLVEGKGTPIVDEIQMRTQGWAMLGLDEVLFDVYVDGPKSECASYAADASPVVA